MRKLLVLRLSFLLCTLAAAPAGAQWMTFRDEASGFTMSVPDDWFVLEPDNAITTVYELPVLAHYELHDPAASHAVSIYVLANPLHLGLENFLYGDRDGADVLIPRNLQTGGGQDLVQVGYAYDPPLYAAIDVEVEHLVALSADVDVDVQLFVSVDQPYEDLLAHIVASFAAVPPAEGYRLGDVKSLYR